MDRPAAIKLAEKYRSDAQPQESQATVARRAGRSYGAAGVMFVGMAVIILVDHVTDNTLTVFRICLCLLFCRGCLVLRAWIQIQASCEGVNR